MILDFLNEVLPWRNCKDNKADDVRDTKNVCLSNPENFLWLTTTRDIPEVRTIFQSISKLQYADRPDYDFIRGQLMTMLQREEAKELSLRSLDTKSSSSVLFYTFNLCHRRNELVQESTTSNRIKECLHCIFHRWYKIHLQSIMGCITLIMAVFQDQWIQQC